jgi:hypothetical protein
MSAGDDATQQAMALALMHLGAAIEHVETMTNALTEEIEHFVANGERLIVVTVPHSACVIRMPNGTSLKISEAELNSNDPAYLNMLQTTLNNALCNSLSQDRECDRRAVVGAIALKLAFMHFIMTSHPMAKDVGMITMLNDYQPRAECDANRFHPPSEGCEYQTHVIDVLGDMEKKGYRLAWNIDTHSFPPSSHPLSKEENIYMLARVHPEPVASKKWALLKQNFMFSVYAGSERNYFMKWFEETKRVPSLLVEFSEFAGGYSLNQLNMDAHLIVKFVLENIGLYETLQ